ncbi:Crp/Fnr family transcriptional regulator [Bacillus sp. DJP31]|uniref:Crp/Fnr family transcriptional regulator n=1 Tax=Bacillus sp. DJP31 TaxID=3409789 RepID=UPI003BB5BFB9
MSTQNFNNLLESFDKFHELLLLVHHTLNLKKGSFLFTEGMPAKEIYVIKSGKIQVSKVTPDGKELTLRICSVNEIVGELTLFTKDPKYLLNAKVIEDCEVGVIKKDVLEEELFHNNQLSIEYMKWMSDHFRRTHTKFRDLVMLGKKGALYSTLIRMTNSYGIKTTNGILIDMYLTNQILANFCGTTRESINRMLSELRKNNILTIQSGKITIQDLGYLKKEVGCENCDAKYCTIE